MRSIMKRVLKLFNPGSPRNNTKDDQGNLKKLTYQQIKNILEEVDNSPKLLTLLINNLQYLEKSVDIALVSDDNLTSDRLFVLLGQKKAYWYLLRLLTDQINVEFKDEEND